MHSAAKSCRARRGCWLVNIDLRLVGRDSSISQLEGSACPPTTLVWGLDASVRRETAHLSKWHRAIRAGSSGPKKASFNQHEGVSLYSYLVLSSQAVATSSEQLYTTLELCTAVAHD